MHELFRDAGLLIVLGWSCFFTTTVSAIQPPEGLVTLSEAVVLTDDERAFIQSLPTLKVAAYRQAQPLSLFDEKTETYQGISIDVFRFIADQVGLAYEFVNDKKSSLAEDLKRIQDGKLDVYMPLSMQPERLQYGMFTESYFDDYYAIIARKNTLLHISDLNQLSRLNQYRVGVSNKASILPYLQSFINPQQLYEYADGLLFEGLLKEEVDVAFYLQSVFEQERFRFEMFDLEKRYTLYQQPRSYAFMFAHSGQNEQLIQIFNRFIRVIDNSASVRLHTGGERQFITKYVKQQSRQQLLLIILMTASIVLLILLLALRSRQRIVVRLAESHRARQDANSQLKQLSQLDSLTGLANRRYFDRQFTLEYARHIRTGAALSVLMVDIDFFKNVNDCFGHAEGDIYLQKIAVTLKTMLSRPTDFIARYGGEEFICLLPSTDLNGALIVAERIRKAVFALNLDNALGHSGAVTVSVGVATLSEGQQHSASELLTQADKQLYRAKNSGRNQVCGVALGQHKTSMRPVT